jgi:hypothetical protein
VLGLFISAGSGRAAMATLLTEAAATAEIAAVLKKLRRFMLEFPLTWVYSEPLNELLHKLLNGQVKHWP